MAVDVEGSRRGKVWDSFGFGGVTVFRVGWGWMDCGLWIVAADVGLGVWVCGLGLDGWVCPCLVLLFGVMRFVDLCLCEVM